MYPTVNSLMDLWRFVTARKIAVVEHCHNDIQSFLHRLNANPDDLFVRETWKKTDGFRSSDPRR
jgi:hypothetical protein